MSDIKCARDVVERIAETCRSLSRRRSARLNGPVKNDNTSPFVEQLLRYVDDKRYSRAHAAAEEAVIHIDARPGRIVFAFNADELLERDIFSLCGLRSDQDGEALPERGIGLERAVRAGWRVYLRSGNFSLYFGHPIADGLIPIWDDSEDGPHDGKTRITLQLQREKSGSSISAACPDFCKQVQELQPEHLLFLRQLRRIGIDIRNEAGDSGSAEFQMRNRADNVAVVSASFRRGDETITRERHYCVTRTTIRHTLGTSTAEHFRDNGVKDASPEVLLAFPVDVNFVPVLEPQELYAFFSLGSFGFKFLIQCNLITDAAAIHPALLDDIANAFVESIKSLCQIPKLRYTWPRFLPLPGEVTEHPWTSLVDRIKVRVGKVPVLRTFQSDELRCIQQLRLPTPEDMGQDGTLLLGDSALELYLSRGYGEQDLAVLQQYGLRSMDVGEILALIQADLESPDSKMRSSTTDQDWHSRVARLMLRGLSHGEEKHSALATQLNMIPLRDGAWCSAASGPIYWPRTQESAIPSHFTARIVDDVAARNPERRLLFQYLGVQEASVGDVRTQILNKPRAPGQITVAECRDELQFLYLTHAHRRIDEDWQHIVVLNQQLEPVRPREEDVYFLGMSRYSPENLFQSSSSDDDEDDDRPGFSASFLHPDIAGSDLILPGLVHPTWRKWLVEFVGIREQVRLVSRAGDAISECFAYVAEHQQEVILDVLEQLWQAEGVLVVSNADLLNQVRQTPVPCLSGFLHPLWETYLPLEDLQRRHLQFMEPDEAFPFVDLGGQPSAEELANKWSFLYTHLGVSRNNDLGFLLDILSYIQLANLNGLSLRRCRDVVRLYCELERRCAESMEPESLRVICRHYIQDIQGIIIPAAFDAPSRWTDSKRCLWDAPLCMTTKPPLRLLYEHTFQLEPAELETLSSFFLQTVGIACLSIRDLIVELSTLRDGGSRDLGRVARIYGCLNGLAKLETRQELRRLFENEALILVSSNGQPKWAKLGQCLWSSPVEIPGKAAVNAYYAPLEDFFVRTLGVGLLTVDMVYGRLLEIEGRGPPFSELKNVLWLLSSFVETGTSLPSPTPLLKRKIFPVRYPDGSKALVSAETDFALIDRDALAERFAGHVRLLDFALEEVARLKPLLGWLGLEQRYLSVCVSDRTFLSGEARVPICSANRDLKYKAHAFTRIAAAFASPRYKRGPMRLYETLRAAQVVETDGISSVDSITQDGRVVASQVVKGEVHLAEEPAGLMVYVPREPSAQDLCFAAVLPRRLGRWLMQDPAAQLDGSVEERLVTVLGAVLNADIPVVDRVLAHEGVGHINMPAGPITQDMALASRQRTLSHWAGSGQWTMPPTPQSTDVESPRRHVQEAPRRRD